MKDYDSYNLYKDLARKAFMDNDMEAAEIFKKKAYKALEE